ncbi:MAG TPA: hypothetical protein VMT17_17330 [Anaeromyxobacteraceae bacterium]|nr:hypothetical protein [Anaeromyxobacteraceae bacterium]
MLRWVAVVSGFYDVAAGSVLLLAPEPLAAILGVKATGPALLADIAGLFAVAVGIGYFVVLRDLERHRAYLWLMGPFLKGLGAAAFVQDYILRRSAWTILLFAFCDAALAVVTLLALVRSPKPRP